MGLAGRGRAAVEPGSAIASMAIIDTAVLVASPRGARVVLNRSVPPVGRSLPPDGRVSIKRAIAA